MKALLKKGMDEGYAGFSTDALPFHFLANDPNRQKQIPTQFASFSEIKELTSILRDYDRVWQATTGHALIACSKFKTSQWSFLHASLGRAL